MVNCPHLSGNSGALGVFSDGNTIYLVSRLLENNESFLHIDKSTDGITFDHYSSQADFKDSQRRKIDLTKCEDFRISKFKDRYILTYKWNGRETSLYTGTSSDFIHWKRLGKTSVYDTGMVVPDYSHNGLHVMFAGEHSINVYTSGDCLNWDKQEEVVVPHQDFYGTWPVKVGSVSLTADGILLLYFVQKKEESFDRYELRGALFDKSDPTKLIEHFEEPVWESTDEWGAKHARPLGVVALSEVFVSFWTFDEGGVFAVLHPTVEKSSITKKGVPGVILNKIKENPIIRPIFDHFWESKATFNPAAFYEKGKVHIVYRAIGDSDVSVLGYATSSDGVHIDDRHDEPAYIPTEPFESSSAYIAASPTPYASGGGCYGGCEDPRITKIGDKLYMTYVAYDGWSPPRVAITSISVDDFLTRKWNWKTPVLISKPGQVNKNAAILPEKINGKYVIFHRVFPDILVDYVDSLDFEDGNYLQDKYRISPRKTHWDSRKVGVGAPPIKTDEGWLLIYQAVGNQDPGRYKMGAMLLALDDPTKVLYRSSSPILEPTEHYENEGHKAGVAYPCGAVVLNDTLHVYYGGADMVSCVATAPLPKFLDNLKSSGSAELIPLGLQAIR